MKAETKFTNHISSGHPDLASQQKDLSQGYEHQPASKAKYSHSTEEHEKIPINDFGKSIPERFENTVRKYPKSLAVKKGDSSLTYEQLNRAANRIGRSILEMQGIKIEPVALLFEHGIDGIAAIFGTLKTGKFYVALDPTFPAQRNAYMLDDSQGTLIVTNNRNLDLAHQLATNGRSVLNSDEIDNGLLSDNLGVFVAPESRMCIGYTSGSTGNPKGVVRIQRNSATSAINMPIRPDDRFSLIHSVSFGSASASLFSTLLNGASLFPFDIKSEGIARFANWLAEEQITICHLPPAAFRELAHFLSTQELRLNLRLIRLSGAPITRQDFELYKKNFSPPTLLSINMSSTEAGGSFSATVDHTFHFPQQGTPLGYPVPGKQVLLLDDDGREVEADQVGEIAIRGRIHPGYWRRPDLTSAKFLPDPSGGEESVYLTGDLGRMLPNGFLIHLGRKDFMVKIRGYRVEPSEIESALLAHPQVRQAGVVAWDKELGEKYLVAYVVSRDDATLTNSELHDFLKGELPEYMMPSSYVFLRSLPLTNGKLDRSQLSLPDKKRPDMGHAYVPPHTEVEQLLVQIWEKVLDVHPIGIHDDFFELGGHSLLGLRLVMEIEKAFGKSLPDTILRFWAPNVDQLARIIQQELWPTPGSSLFPIQPSGSKPPFFWVYGRTSNVLLPRYLGPDQPLYGLMREGCTGNRALYTQVKDIAAAQLKEIRTVRPEGPYFLGGFGFGGMVAFELSQQLRRQGQEVALLFLVDPAAIRICKSLLDQGPNQQKLLSKISFLQNRVFRETQRLFSKPKLLRNKIARHFSDLKSIGAQEKFEYAKVRVKDRISQMIALVEPLIRNLYFIIGRPLPPLRRGQYLRSVEHWAMQHYEPEAYPDNVVLFNSEAEISDSAWVPKFVIGKLRLRELPCSHMELLEEPHIALWAKELRNYLQKAQATHRGAHPSRSSRQASEESLAD